MSLKKRIQCGIDVVRVLEAYDLQSENPVSVIQHRGRQPFYSAKFLLQVLARHCERVMDAYFLRELKWVFHVRHRLEFESDHHKSARAVAIFELLVTGHLFFAGLAPSRPEIDKNNFP